MIRILLTGFLWLSVSVSAYAETAVRSGLWEITTKSDLLGLVEHVPEEKMQQIGNLAKRYGLKIPRIRNGAALSKVCLTPEMIAQDIPAEFRETQTGCIVKNVHRTENRFRMEFVCDSPHFKGSGHAEGVFDSPESFTGKTEFDSHEQGVPTHVSADTTGRWIGEYCRVE